MKNFKDKTKDDAVKVHGFFRVQLTEDEEGKSKVTGDSGWNKNTVVNLGFDQYLCQTLAGAAGSKTISHAALGATTAPDATDTNLPGELAHTADARKTLSTSTILSKTIQFTAAFNSTDSFVTLASTISNVGLFNVSSVTGGTIFAGNTYSSSTINTNQNVNVTYQIRFS